MRSSETEQGNSNDVLVLNARELEPFEIGARLDALLCYPTWSSERQLQIADAICAELVSYSIEVDSSRKADLTSRYPQYTKDRRRTALGSLHERREKALTFGQAFLPLLKQAATGELPILYGERRELSISEIVRFIWPPREDGAEINYADRLHDRQRELRSYRTIAHLAAAYEYVARQRSGPNQAAALDYQDLGLHRDLVRRAHEFAGYFRGIPTLMPIGNRLLDIEWRD